METVGGVMEVLIPENTTNYITKEHVFSFFSNNQLGLLVHTYKGERHWMRDKNPLNKFTMYRIPPAPRGVPRSKDYFNIDANGEKQVRFFIHSNPQEPMLLWNGIWCDSLTLHVIKCFEQFSDHGGSDSHSAWHQKFAHTANILGNFAHQFMYFSYIDIGIQVQRRLLMEHISLMICDFHLGQTHCEADVVTTPISIFTLHAKPRNRNIGVQNGNHKGGGMEALGEKIASGTKKTCWVLQRIDVSKTFSEITVVFRFVDENFINNFCSDLWLKKYGIRPCLSTFEMIKFAGFLIASIHIGETTDNCELNMENIVYQQRLMEQSCNLLVSWILGSIFKHTNAVPEISAFFRDPISYEAFNDSLRVTFSNLQEVSSKTLMKKFQYYGEIVDRVFEMLSTSVGTYFRGDDFSKTIVVWFHDEFKRCGDMCHLRDEKIKRELSSTAHDYDNAEACWTTSHPSLGSLKTVDMFYPNEKFLGVVASTLNGYLIHLYKGLGQPILVYMGVERSAPPAQARIDSHNKVIFKRKFACNLFASVFTWRRKFLVFALPRPPEVNDLEDKVQFKGMK
ncbi:hypothetical protein QQ045_010849 [Rhodiola kirilowii]